MNTDTAQEARLVGILDTAVAEQDRREAGHAAAAVQDHYRATRKRISARVNALIEAGFEISCGDSLGFTEYHA